MSRSTPPKRSSRLLLIVAGIIVVIGLLIRLLDRDEKPDVTAPVEVEPKPATHLAEVQPTPDSAQRHEASLPFQLRATEVRRADGPEADADSPAETPAGEWQVFSLAEDYEEEIGRAEFTLEPPDRLLIEESRNFYAFPDGFTIDGLHVESDPYDNGDVTASYSGSFNEAMTELKLSGVVKQTFNGQTYSSNQDLHFVKVDEEQLLRERRLTQYKEEVSMIFTALRNYAYANEGRMPRRLEDLVPEYLSDGSVLVPKADRNVIYNADGTSLYRGKAPVWEPYKQDTAEEMIADEARLRAYWGSDLIDPEPVLTVEYEMGEVVFHGSAFFGVYSDDVNFSRFGEIRPLNGVDSEDARITAIRMKCANHMKQLGLCMKMFENESKDERFPAGPYMLYPEYLPDPSVLTCPSVERGIESYEFVHPAVNAGDMQALYREVTGKEAPANYQSEVPVLAETHYCAGGDLLHVLFADGHVQLYTPEAFDEVVAPFLAVRIH